MAKYYPTRKIGTDDVSAIGFGAMGIGAYYGQTGPDEERLKVKRELAPRHITN
jgi:hypothetical protein